LFSLLASLLSLFSLFTLLCSLSSPPAATPVPPFLLLLLLLLPHLLHLISSPPLLSFRAPSARASSYLPVSGTSLTRRPFSSNVGVVKFIMSFDNAIVAGRFVYHCHILDHEDGGMMGAIYVNATGPATSTTSAASS